MKINPVVASCLGLGLALSACSSGGGSVTTEIGDLKIGDCFTSSEDIEATSVDVVACSEEHDGEVYLILQLKDLGPDFSDVMISEWEDYTGQAYDASEAYGFMLPSSNGGNIVVASYDVEGKSTGSIKAN